MIYYKISENFMVKLMFQVINDITKVDKSATIVSIST